MERPACIAQVLLCLVRRSAGMCSGALSGIDWCAGALSSPGTPSPASSGAQLARPDAVEPAYIGPAVQERAGRATVARVGPAGARLRIGGGDQRQLAALCFRRRGQAARARADRRAGHPGAAG